MKSKNGEIKYPRESGILLHISSLPSEFGIGSLGNAAYRFIDFLRESGQKYWQILPLCPIGEGNSPYSSKSCFAGEPLFIDIEQLVNDGYLEPYDLSPPETGQNTNYEKARNIKIPLIKKACAGFNTKNRDYIHFKKENAFWLDDYALFSVISEIFGTRDFSLWEDAFKYRLPGALKNLAEAEYEKIEFYKTEQYFFFTQYKKLKKYAEKNGIKIIGDIPFYVSLNSADVWSNPDIFRLGRDMTPLFVGGTPPDKFSDDGQLWGNPVYDWDTQRKNGYNWWKKRFKWNSSLYDTVRIDHFRAFSEYYTVPYGETDAKCGKWEKGPGVNFWKEVKESCTAEIIAEDLGGDTPDVQKLIEDTGFPNIKVLQFAFSDSLENPHLPKNYQANCVCYTGTHDNDTALGWYSAASAHEKLMFSKLVPADKSESAVLSLISYAMKSKARLVIIPLQDYLRLDSRARFNTPGIPTGNWQWRYTEKMLDSELAETVKRLTKGRN